MSKQKVPVVDNLVSLIPKTWIPEWMPSWGPQVVVGVVLLALVLTLWRVFLVFAKLAIVLAALAGAAIFVVWLAQKIQEDLDPPKKGPKGPPS